MTELGRPVIGSMKVDLRILIVYDGRVDTSSGPDQFGLGPVIRNLTFWLTRWVSVSVSAVNREVDTAPTLYPAISTWRAAAAPRPAVAPPRVAAAEVIAFRFDQPGFDLNEYDQLWLFGDLPAGGDDDPSSDASIARYALTDGELAVIARWMERGGGVFATGDHGILGASLCSQIPRVRRMRRWTHADGVPRSLGSTVHQTYNMRDFVPPGDPEMDEHPQPLYLMNQGGFEADRIVPHPLLCGPDGPIDRFPDHMHEGAVVEDDAVRLDDPLDIVGFDGVEFPSVQPDPALPPVRPVPQVIARVVTTYEQTKSFPALGVWDGDPVDCGRVVVDSTWHHWFSMNILPFEGANRPVWDAMVQFQRNVAMWLATPEQRRAMLTTLIWDAVLTAPPMRFLRAFSIREFGLRALDVLGRDAPHCVVSELVSAFEDGFGRFVSPRPQRALGDTVEVFVVGGIARRLHVLAGDHLERVRSSQRPIVDFGQLEQAVVEGLADARRELRQEFDATVEEIAVLCDRFDRPVDVAVSGRQLSVTAPVGLLAVVLERVEPADPSDPLLTDREARVYVEVDVGRTRLFARPVPLGVVGLEVGRVVVQPGEELSVRASADVVGLAGGPVECFVDVLAGDPRSWVGRHVPDAGHRLRLWYRLVAVASAVGA